MDFYALLAFAVAFVTIGYLLGSYERKLDKHGLPGITTPDDPRDLINNLQGQVAAQRIVMQRWVDEAKAMGFDGVASALHSIRARPNITLRISANSTSMENDMSKVVSMLDRKIKGSKQ